MRTRGWACLAGDGPQDQEDQSLQQVANVATLPGIVGPSLAMPDIHWGYGFPIGGVAAISPGGGGGFPRRRGLRHQLRGAAAAHQPARARRIQPRMRATDGCPVSRIPAGVGTGGPYSLRRQGTAAADGRGPPLPGHTAAGPRPAIWNTPRPAAGSKGADPEYVSPSGPLRTRRRPVRHPRLGQPFLSK